MKKNWDKGNLLLREEEPQQYTTLVRLKNPHQVDAYHVAPIPLVQEETLVPVSNKLVGVGLIAGLAAIIWMFVDLRSSTARVETGQKQLTERIDGGFETLATSIIELHQKDQDAAVILLRLRSTFKLKSKADGDVAVLGLPFKYAAKDLALETGHLAGTVALNVVNAKRNEIVDVLAVLDGKIVSISRADEPISRKDPRRGHRIFTTIVVQHEDGTIIEYSRLMGERAEIKNGSSVRKGDPIGLAQAYSPVCLRLCLRLFDGGGCLDTRSLFPEIPVVPEGSSLAKFLESRQPSA